VRKSVADAVLAVVLAVGLATCVTAAAAPAAYAAGTAAAGSQAPAAAKLPVVYIYGMGGVWSGPRVKPSYIVFGADTEVNKLHWTHWTTRSAFASGQWLACAGALGPCEKWTGKVSLTRVAAHKGTRYFSWLVITAKHHRTITYKYTSTGWWSA
jgi:hypothetical protein